MSPLEAGALPPEAGASPRPVAVIGGGISGLTAAFELVEAGRSVMLFEAADSLGGKIAETSIDGTVIPTGPDAFLARRPEVTELAQRLGLAESLVSPVARSARIYRDGQLHPLPPNVLGVPATTDLTATGLISAEGAERAQRGPADAQGQDQGAAPEDESVGSLIRRELGDEVLEFLVDPLLGGINAGDSDRLSVVSGVPQLDALRRRDGRLLDAAAATLAEAAQRAPQGDAPAIFHSIDGGLGRLIDRLVDHLNQSGRCEIRTSNNAKIAQTEDGWLVNGVEVDQIISTVPARHAAALVADVAPDAANLLCEIEYSSVSLILLTLAPGTIDLDQEISGVLVPRSLGHHVTAISFASHKWPTLAVGGRQVLRVSVGRRTDSRWIDFDDETLVSEIERDLSEIFSTTVEAVHTHVTRWTHALPQYDVGHQQRIEQLDRHLADVSGIHLTGAWRDGLGLPACVAAGRQAAQHAISA